ncbi:hypothetical protein HD554DRAFT_2172308 [Boletus coccyginus]|nr:hypothetical protein HD554DRAFT_2172308 [Boletus coccyginus]
MSTTPLPASGYATPHSVASSSTSLSTTAKAPSKPKPVNVFSNDGSFLERFQRSRQEDDDKRKAEEALARLIVFSFSAIALGAEIAFARARPPGRNNSQIDSCVPSRPHPTFALTLGPPPPPTHTQKNRGKRPPPDSPRAVTSTDLGANDSPAKRPKLDDAPLPQASEYQKWVRDHAGRVLKDGGTGVRPLVK